MGKSPEKLRLTILIDHDMFTDPKAAPSLDELREKGHTLLGLEGPYHLILSRHAHMWADDMWPLLPITLKAARARKKGQERESDQE